MQISNVFCGFVTFQNGIFHVIIWYGTDAVETLNIREGISPWKKLDFHERNCTYLISFFPESLVFCHVL